MMIFPLSFLSPLATNNPKAEKHLRLAFYQHVICGGQKGQNSGILSGCGQNNRSGQKGQNSGNGQNSI
jgi:hypothetical protein